MSALLEGFRTGYGAMNQHNQQEENKRRYDQGIQRQAEQDTQANARYDQGILRQTEQDNMTKASHDIQMANAGLQHTVNQNNVDRMPVNNTREDNLSALELSNAKSQGEINQLNIANTKDSNKQNKAKTKLQNYMISKDWSGLVNDKDFKDSDVSLIFSGVGRKSAVGLSQAIQNKDWTTATQHFNSLYKSKLNKMVGKTKGRDGSMIRDVSAMGFEVQEDGVVKIPVQVTTENGTYTSYISNLRGSDENDKPKQFSVDELIGKAASLGELANIMESSGVSGQMGQRADEYSRRNNPNKQTLPAESQIAVHMSESMGITVGEAYQLRSNAKVNPNALKIAKAKFVQSALKGQDFLEPEEKNEIVKNASSMFDQFMNEQPTQPGQPNTDPSNQYSSILQQAQAAVSQGKDKNAVIQRLIDMGVPQDQINL
jgi:hypothetical protein